MSIYRGAGGSGDATNDANSQAILARAAASAAEVSKNQAQASAAAASTSASNASSSASSASASASSASASAAAAIVTLSTSLLKANNLSDLTSVSTARTNLGLGTAALVADNTLVHLAGTETITGAKTFSTLITGSISGNAATVTDGVYTTGSYADPAWITSLAGSKITGTLDGGTF